MNRTYAKRAFTIALSFLLVLTFTVLSTVQADAASKKKTIYVPVSSSSTMQFGEGSVSTTTYKYTYNKKGLLTKSTVKQPDSTVKITWKRNAKGAPVSTRTKMDGKLTAMTKYKVNNKGLVTQSTDYTFEKGKKQRDSVTKYTYYKNGQVKKSVFTSFDGGKASYTTYFRKDGTIQKTISADKESTYKTIYNKKGDEIKVNYKLPYGKGIATTSYTYDKKGNEQKSVRTDKFTNNNGTVTTNITNSTYNYTYDKHGNITKQYTSFESNDDGTISTSSSVDTTKYKKIKVAKKYLKYIKEV
jgi:hypothetical protein